MNAKIIFLVAMLALSACQSRETTSDTAPGFELERLEGGTLSSAQVQGKVVIVDFWATWCQPCIREIPGYNHLHEKYAAEGVALIGVVMQSGSAEELLEFKDQHGMKYDTYLGDSEIASSFGGIMALPTTFVIDRDWKIRKKYIGTRPGKIAEIDKLVASLLEGEAN